MKTKTLLLLVVSALLFSILGCASMRASTAERQYIERATANYVHTRDLDSVLATAQKLLFEQGFQVRETGAKSLETEYLRERDDDVRYLVTATQSGKGWQLNFTRDKLDTRTSTAKTSRDLKMEWELIGRVDPHWYNRTKQEAQAAGKVAK